MNLTAKRIPIQRSKVNRRWKFWIIGCVRVFDGLVVVLSLGYLASNIYANLLFSDWADDID